LERKRKTRRYNMKRFGLSLVLIMLIPAVASAHGYIRSVSPAKDSVVAEPPERVTMKFGSAMERMFSKLAVFGPAGEKVSKKTVFSEDNSAMEVELEEGLGAGKYTVRWKGMSKDGHSQKGSFSFSVK
jgi:methionine-rich copper-binding protein CopC